MARGQFIKVKCDGCGNEQVIFNKPADDVQCVVCDDVLAASRGGKAEVAATILEDVA